MAEHNYEERDDNLPEKLTRFLNDGCGCTLGPKKGSCSGQFLQETILFNLNNCLELSSLELDLVILMSIHAFTQAESIGRKEGVLVVRSTSSQCQYAKKCLRDCMA